jgi:hypothetical protein
MAEEQKVETPAQEEAPQQQTPEVSEVELQAREQGWVPKEEWTGDPAKWRPADIFVDRGELLTKIKSQSSEMRELKGMLNHLAEQNRKLYEAGYKRALDELATQRDAAIEAGDARAVREYDTQIRAHEQALEEAKKPKVLADNRQTAEQNYRAFLARNRWYETDEAMQDWANGRAVRFKNSNPNVTDIEVYEHLEEEARKRYPEKFKRVGAPNPDGKGERSGGSPPKKDGNSEFDALLSSLSEDEAHIARNLVKRGHVTKEKFIEDYKLVGGLK